MKKIIELIKKLFGVGSFQEKKAELTELESDIKTELETVKETIKTDVNIVKNKVKKITTKK